MVHEKNGCGRKLASIDFGTNTARLLIAHLRDQNEIVKILIEREITRMGGGFTPENGLSVDAMRRGVACLERFASIVRSHGVENIRAVATSAVREAVNGRLFLDMVKRETGINLRIIDGEEEGALTLAGVMLGLDREHEELLLFDIGGGSTEFIFARDGKRVFSKSLPLGVVRLVESGDDEDAIRERIRRQLEAVVSEMSINGAGISGRTALVGSAGTATTLAAIKLGLREYDYRLVNNSLLTRGDIQEIYDRLAPLSLEERLAIPGLEKGREDLIIAGIMITAMTMDIFNITEMKVSDYGILEGVAIADTL